MGECDFGYYVVAKVWISSKSRSARSNGMFRLEGRHQNEIGLITASRAAGGPREELLGTENSELVDATPVNQV